MGRSERDRMQSRIRQILIHLLKWQFQPWLRSRTWRNALWVQRRALAKLLRRNPSLRDFYQRLIAAGKAKELALTAAMRKLLVILNAILRDRQPWRAPQPA